MGRHLRRAACFALFALMVCCLGTSDRSASAQPVPNAGPTVIVPGSASINPGMSVTFYYAPGCPRGEPGQPRPSCGCCLPRSLGVTNASNQTAGVSYSPNTLEVLLPAGWVPRVYLVRQGSGFDGCAPVAGLANDVRCTVPIVGGPPGTAVAVMIQAQAAAAPVDDVAVPANTAVALVVPRPAADSAAVDGLVANNRSPLPAELTWSGDSLALTVMPGFTPLLTSRPATTLADCAAVEQQPNVLSCSVGIDPSRVALGSPPPATVARLAFTVFAGDTLSETAQVEPGGGAVFLGTQPDAATGAVPVVSIEQLAQSTGYGASADWDGATLTLNAGPSAELGVTVAEEASCGAGGAPGAISCTTTGVPPARLVFAVTGGRTGPGGPPALIGQIVDPPTTGSVGVALAFSARIDSPAGLAGGLTVQRIDWDFGDGATASGPSVTHSYMAAGIYTVNLIITDSRGTRTGSFAAVQIFPFGAAVLPPSVEVDYSAGWNLVAGSSYLPDGVQAVGADVTTLPRGVAFSTLLPDGSAYAEVPPGTPLVAGVGYWAYFPSPATVMVSGEPRPLVRPLPADRWVLIGNPFTAAASVSGADLVEAYDAETGGYVATTVLQPGQGAWAYSATGGNLSLTVAQNP